MEGRFLIGSNVSFVEGNIYADKSAVILAWLLTEGMNRKVFSLREVAKICKVSVGLVQRVFKILVFYGILRTEGVRTAKQFFLSKPKTLLESWIKQYHLLKKCKVATYQTGLSGKKEILSILKQSELGNKVALALHSAAEELGCKNTNLETVELYVLDSRSQKKIEELLLLRPQEKGYDVLLIEPYYKSLLDQRGGVAHPLLTYLDLYHFPLRGQEQAEFMAQRLPELKKIYAKRR